MPAEQPGLPTQRREAQELMISIYHRRVKVSAYGGLLRGELAAQPVTRRCCRLAEAIVVLQVNSPFTAPGSFLDEAVLRRLRILVGPQMSLPQLPARLGLLDHDGARLRGVPRALATGSGLCCATAMSRGAILAAGDLRAGRTRLRLIIDFPTVEIAVAVAGALRRLGTITGLRAHVDDEGEQLRVDDAVPLLHTLHAVDTCTMWANRLQGRAFIPRPRVDVSGHLRQLNEHRSRQAAAAATTRVTAALDKLGKQPVPQELVQAGQLRIRHPHATLTELAALADPPLSKDAITGRLRRLLAMAERHPDMT